MTRRYFTLNETNALVPTLEQAFQRISQMHAQVRDAWIRLDAIGCAPDDEDFIVDEHTPPDAVDDLATLRTLLDALREDIDRVQATGCTIKRLDIGLVDWYAEREGREVFLCWQLGEKEVGYWHEIDAGFAGRRPISEF
ncbi:MAG: DUF2203 domain-containing protein [Pseudomonadota bacterium]